MTHMLQDRLSTRPFYNNDLGKTIDKPLVQPARRRSFKEGGSYDFIVENQGKTYLIRPSFNYIEHQLDNVHADVLYLAIGGMSSANRQTRQTFFAPLNKNARDLSSVYVKSQKELLQLAEYFETSDISLCVQLPLTSMEF